MSAMHPYRALERNAGEFPNKVAMGALKLGGHQFEQFKTFTWPEILEKTANYAQVFQSKGLRKGDRVTLFAKNQMGWVVADWALFAGGFVSVPIFPQSPKEEIQYIVDEAEVKLIVGDEDPGIPNTAFLSLVDLERESHNFKAPSFRPEFLDEEDISTIVYTSGTTGEPKGVMHSWKSLFDAVLVANKEAKITSKDRQLSYLPLSHVAERMLGEFGSLYSGASVYFVDQVERVSRYLPIVKPTIFLAVPRIWDMIALKIRREISQPQVQQRLMAIPVFIRPFVLKRMIKRKLGLHRARACFSGAAKLNVETAKELANYGIKICEAYGLTETLCVSTINDIENPKIGSVGKAYKGVDLKIASDGEICMKASFHFKGYYKKLSATQEALQDGWFHSGDVGYVDDRGFLIITDRKKDIFKTSGGKYVAPLPIETKLRSHPSIREVMVIGENQPHCVAIASVMDDGDEQSLEALIDRINKVLAPHERIHALACTMEEWSIDGGHLTPSMKLKRREIINQYSEQITNLYNSRKRVDFFLKEALKGRLNAHISI